MTSDYREEYTLSESDCCHYWNMGLHCDETFCQFYHACCFISCRTIFHRSHRAIQHTGVSRCSKWIDSLEGMNIVHPIPLVYDSRSSEEDTLEACKKYNVKPPSLNAELFDSLLKKTYIDENTRDSLVRGWREGFDLGSNLPLENNMVKSPKLDETQKTVLRDGLETEVRLKRMIGPLDKPIKDEKWFKNFYVSPYFVIPKTTPPGMAQKYRLIHHLSFHEDGRAESVNGKIDMEKYPTMFPSPLTGAHLIFCMSPPGSALLGRDIRDYYRNFLLNPYTWWKTYTHALGSFWLNPYLPFGGSSCTSIAQRQSDAIRKVATVYGVKAKTVAMLDDFLIVAPRESGDTDNDVLKRGMTEGNYLTNF